MNLLSNSCQETAKKSENAICRRCVYKVLVAFAQRCVYNKGSRYSHLQKCGYHQMLFALTGVNIL